MDAIGLSKLLEEVQPFVDYVRKNRHDLRSIPNAIQHYRAMSKDPYWQSIFSKINTFRNDSGRKTEATSSAYRDSKGLLLGATVTTPVTVDIGAGCLNKTAKMLKSPTIVAVEPNQDAKAIESASQSFSFSYKRDVIATGHIGLFDHDEKRFSGYECLRVYINSAHLGYRAACGLTIIVCQSNTALDSLGLLKVEDGVALTQYKGKWEPSTQVDHGHFIKRLETHQLRAVYEHQVLNLPHEAARGDWKKGAKPSSPQVTTMVHHLMDCLFRPGRHLYDLFCGDARLSLNYVGEVDAIDIHPTPVLANMTGALHVKFQRETLPKILPKITYLVANPPYGEDHRDLCQWAIQQAYKADAAILVLPVSVRKKNPRLIHITDVDCYGTLVSLCTTVKPSLTKPFVKDITGFDGYETCDITPKYNGARVDISFYPFGSVNYYREEAKISLDSNSVGFKLSVSLELTRAGDILTGYKAPFPTTKDGYKFLSGILGVASPYEPPSGASYDGLIYHTEHGCDFYRKFNNSVDITHLEQPLLEQYGFTLEPAVPKDEIITPAGKKVAKVYEYVREGQTLRLLGERRGKSRPNPKPIKRLTMPTAPHRDFKGYAGRHYNHVPLSVRRFYPPDKNCINLPLETDGGLLLLSDNETKDLGHKNVVQ